MTFDPSNSDRPNPDPTSSASPDVDLDPDLAARIILVSLPRMGPARLRWLSCELAPAEAVAQLAAGSLKITSQAPKGVNRELISVWSETLRSMDLAAVVAAQLVDGRTVIGPGHRYWPFDDDPEPPLLLFCTGDIELLVADRLVSVVGTRRCSAVGRRVAHGLGLDLARSGVSVVSGLAIGVDAASHHGCLDGGGRPLAVVASGLNVIYPEANRALWGEVARCGLVVSEAPAGAEPQRWRFPARNRLIAALGQGTVIVESHSSGGALITADEAADRGRPVMSVPGSVLSPSAEGCNSLLMDGAAPVRDADDVLQYLGIEPRGETTPFNVDSDNASGAEARDDVLSAAPDTADTAESSTLLSDRICLELAGGPAGVDELVAATGSRAPEVLNVLSRLTVAGTVTFDGVTAALPCG